MPMFHVAFSSREMLVKRQIRFLLMACITRNGVPSPADFRHCMEACEVASHVSRRFPTIHLKNGSCSFPVENLNRSQGTGKLGEGSTESASRLENRSEGSNKAEPPSLVPLPERKMPRNEWKSVLHLLFEK